MHTICVILIKFCLLVVVLLCFLCNWSDKFLPHSIVLMLNNDDDKYSKSLLLEKETPLKEETLCCI